MAQRKSQGRQKIELRRIENEEDRLITFSKRRAGIYKKATEISTLCGVDVGVLLFSPSGKPFTCGVPSIEAVADKFLGREKPPSANDITAKLFEAHRKAKIEEHNNTYNELTARVEVLRKEGERLTKTKRAIQEQCWWDADIEDLTLNEEEQFIASMEELKRTAVQRVGELAGAGASASISAPSVARSSANATAPTSV
ncbi:hypothetical protein Nepgr_022208 [Nepenthes gracilis]|uniref:MADS-box domain-containing protein n=1 Tax=Nepenthes gracilis TaxID=150966 RepID=A0AAD3XWL1_NEPGR|nr:hypothetical protein Nepgr_022208 [Nepenthes gracilis]